MEQDHIWDAFQNDSSLIDVGFPARRRFEFIAKQVEPRTRVLNIGVGSGYLEGLLVSKGVEVSCLDPSQKAIERIAEQLGLGDRAKVGYSQKIPFPECSFDYVIMSEVLEHLGDVDIENTLKEVNRVLCENGRFLGTVPADENLQASLVVCPCCGKRFHRWGHVQSFSKDRMFQVLEGFDRSRVKRFSFVDFQQLNWKGKVVGTIQILQSALGQRGSNQNFYFEAIKK